LFFVRNGFRRKAERSSVAAVRCSRRRNDQRSLCPIVYSADHVKSSRVHLSVQENRRERLPRVRGTVERNIARYLVPCTRTVYNDKVITSVIFDNRRLEFRYSPPLHIWAGGRGGEIEFELSIVLTNCRIFSVYRPYFTTNIYRPKTNATNTAPYTRVSQVAATVFILTSSDCIRPFYGYASRNTTDTREY